MTILNDDRITLTVFSKNEILRASLYILDDTNNCFFHNDITHQVHSKISKRCHVLCNNTSL